MRAPPAAPAVRSLRRGLGLAVALLGAIAPARSAGLWDLPALERAPAVEWGARDGLVQEVYYPGEPAAGRPTRVFAYLGRPPAATARPLPAVVLVHGGGGQAFRAWAERWAERGYVALAMDLSGNGPGKVRLPDGGPSLGNPNIFLAADRDADFRAGWTYHAVAAAIRGGSLLAALPEVDATRIGITGISWGGYATCIAAALDPRFKVAVPVYGCGYLQDSSYWKADLLDPLPPDRRARWVRLYDPSSYLAGVRSPILFVTGANDPRYYLDSLCRSAALVPPELRHLAIKIGLKHGHIFDLPEVDRFIDAVLRHGPLPPQIAAPVFRGGLARAAVTARDGTARAELHYAPAGGSWVDRLWTTVPAALDAGGVSGPLPPHRPLLYYFSLFDAHGVAATSVYSEVSP